MNFVNDSSLFPRGFRPRSASGLADGIAGASPGRPQYPYLLDRYGPRRPPWNVAGVDYRVGVPEGAVLRDWRTLGSIPALNGAINLATGLIRLDVAGPSLALDRIDFSLGIGATIYNPNTSNCTALTLTNCNFGMQPTWSEPGSYFINDQKAASYIVKNCTFDGTYMGNQPAFFRIAGNLTLQYCWTKNAFGGQILQFDVQSGSGQLFYQYNLIDTSYTLYGSHFNCLQFDSNSCTVQSPTVTFNTHYQDKLGAAEVFQFYTNGSGITMPTPVLANNCLISRPNFTNLTGPIPVIIASGATTFTCAALVSNGDQVFLSTFPGGQLPGGFSAGTPYYSVNSVNFTSFQLSATSGGSAITATTGSLYVLVSLLFGGPQTESNMIHGGFTVTGGLNKKNYFDQSGAFAAYYSGSMTPAFGWTSSGNVDMNTGATITPT